MCLHFLLHHLFLCSSHTFYTTNLFYSTCHTCQVKSSQLYWWNRFSQDILFQSLFIEKCGLINIQLCRNQQNCPFYVISDQAEDISRLFGVQLYLSGTIGAFHVPAIDDKTKKKFSLRSDVLFVV